MQPIPVALVGAGRVAQAYADALSSMTQLQLVGVVDPRRKAARALAEPFDCDTFASVGALLRHVPDLEAVLICTPPRTHFDLSRRLLEAGVHVLCEKPFTIATDEARELQQLADQVGVTLTMGSKFRFVTDVVRARSMIQSGILGRIVLFEIVFTTRVDMAQSWHVDPAISGGGVLIDNGSHAVDLTRYLFGPIRQVLAIGGLRIQPVPVEDTARLQVRTESAAVGVIDLSWSLHKPDVPFVTVHGSHGTLCLGWKESRYRLATSPDWVRFGSGYDKLAAFRNQLVNFARAIRGHEPLRITSDDAIASVATIEAAYKSMRRSAWQEVPDCSRITAWQPSQDRSPTCRAAG